MAVRKKSNGMATLMAGIVARSFILNRMMEIGMQATAILGKTMVIVTVQAGLQSKVNTVFDGMIYSL